MRRYLGPPPGEPEEDAGHCLFGCPQGAPSTNRLIVREIYTLSNNGDTKFADWVAYRVSDASIGPTRTRTWKADPLLDPAETLEPEDYTGAHAALGTDRGHQAPLASFTGTDHWKDTNLLSNITPQRSALNQGPWMRLEGAVRTLARTDGVETVYVLTGPLYERQMDPLPQADEEHRVPSGYWKVVAIVEDDALELAAFILDQETPRTSSYCAGLTTVDAVEHRSGLDFFSDLNESTEAQLEGSPGTLAAGLGC